VPLEIRQARRDDLGLLLRFLMGREGTATDEPDARRALQDLDPRRCVAWMGMAGDRPVGISTVLLRTIAAGPRTFRAGYWCALYVDPGFRRSMLYPLLPRAMHRGLRAGGLDFVYANVRIPRLVEAHQKIGLKKLGETPVLVKPLAPVALLARHKRVGGGVEAAGRPIDALAGAYRRLRWAGALAGCTVDELPWDSPRMAEVAALWRRASSGRIGQPWTLELLQHRYGAASGASYSLLVVNRGGRLVAAAVYRAVERERLLVGALMDVVAEDGDGLARAIAAVERGAHRRGCHLVLTVDGPGVLPVGALGNAGYLRWGDKYEFLIWPCKDLGPDSPLLDFARWRYAFGDHDAF
jgi:hypothetical protein